VAEADDDLLAPDPLADVRLRLVGAEIAALDLAGGLVRSAVLGAAQCADRARDGRVDVRVGAGDHACGEGRGVELMLGIEDQRGVHGAHPLGRGCLAVQQVQEVSADRLVVGLDLDAPAVVGEVIPIEQHGAEAGNQAVADVAGGGHRHFVFLRLQGAEERGAGAHHVHRVRRGRDLLQCGLECRGQTAQRAQLAFVGRKLGTRRQMPVDQQIGDLLELGLIGEVEDVVAPVMQIVAGAPDGADGGVACGGAGQGDRFLRFRQLALLVLRPSCSP
jgi:hypothetical protein